MTAFVQLTFQLSPLAVTVTENPGSSTDTLENIAPSAHARSSAVFIGILHKVSDPAPDHRELRLWNVDDPSRYAIKQHSFGPRLGGLIQSINSSYICYKYLLLLDALGGGMRLGEVFFGRRRYDK